MASKKHRQAQLTTWLAPVWVFAAFFSGTTYALMPDAPGKGVLQSEWAKRTKDQHYAGCSQARANHHEAIGIWEPSYRASMDRDADGLACEPY
jgi:hypothetical protein